MTDMLLNGRKKNGKKYKGWDPTKERSTYDLAFYEKHRKYYQRGVLNFKKWIDDNFDYASIVDVGCGQGDFLKPFEDAGKEVLGIDFSKGATDGLVIKPEHYFDHDLTQPLSISSRHYDVVYSLEVYEHIPDEFELTYLKNLMSFNAKTLIVSCAAPGQIGRSHYNCVGRDEMIQKLATLSNGAYRCNDALTASFSVIKGLASFYRKNTAVFDRVI